MSATNKKKIEETKSPYSTKLMLYFFIVTISKNPEISDLKRKIVAIFVSPPCFSGLIFKFNVCEHIYAVLTDTAAKLAR